VRVTTAAGVAALVAVSAAAARAQRVRGVLRDSASGEPIAGAVVWATDSAGRFLARTVSVDSGVFAVPRLVGTARLHILRIGYGPRELAVPRGPGDTMLVVRMLAVPLQLAAIEAHGEKVCPGEHAGAGALALWSQARSALYAGVVAREANPPHIRLFSYTRTLEPVRHTVIDDSTVTKELVADQSYVAARPAWAFARDGYMTEEGGERTFYAPDEAVLLDSAFVDTHCLHSVTGDARHSGEVGVAFEPITAHGRDTLVDIAGALWIDPHRAALRSLEFKYTGLEPAASDESGGEVVFTVNAHGAPMVSRWKIRAAELASDAHETVDGIRHRLPPRTDRTDVHVVHYLDTGGQLTSIMWGAGDTSAETFVRGIVSDESRHPVRGVRVWLSKGGDTAVTDAEGRFAIAGVAPGRYVAMAADSALATIGTSRALPMNVDVLGADQPPIHMLYLGAASVLSFFCLPTHPPTGAILARIVALDGQPIAHARVDVYPDSADVVARENARQQLTTNAQGYAAACGLSVGRRFWVRAESQSIASVGSAIVAAPDVTPLRIVMPR
jgi:carboxypeptidase family protein